MSVSSTGVATTADRMVSSIATTVTNDGEADDFTARRRDSVRATTSPAAFNVTEAAQPEVDYAQLDAGTLLLVVVYCIVFVLSVTGNSTVLYIIGRHLRYRTATNVFITVLSLSDLASALVCMPLTVAKLHNSSVADSTSFGSSTLESVICAVDGVLARASGLLSTAMLSLLTVDRYLTIVHQRRAPFVARRTFTVVAIVVSGSAILSSAWYALRTMVLAGGSTARPGMTLATSLFERRVSPGCLLNGSTPYELVYVAMVAGGPAVLTTYCALRLVRVVARSARCVRPTTTAANQLLFHDELQTAITVVVMVAMFVVCRLTEFVLVWLVVSTTTGSKPHVTSSSRSINAAAALVVWANGAVNPVVYAARNPNIALLLHVDIGLFRRLRRRGYVADAIVPQPSVTTITQQQPPVSQTATVIDSSLSGDTSTADTPMSVKSTIADKRKSVAVDAGRKCERRWPSKTSVEPQSSSHENEDSGCDLDTGPPRVGRRRFDSLVAVEYQLQQLQSMTSSSSDNWSYRRSFSIPGIHYLQRRKSSESSDRTTCTVISVPF
jgi:7 transmembrane receptor (rhodopsin family)